MAKDDTAPAGLFSKMVKFVRSPGTQWNDLDEASSVKEGSLSKQALKEMIERKRRNDFVRKREFDMLRKLRRREASGGGPADASVRPSFFQSSMPSRPDDRAMTLKKIDEIEAQMSMQWWKTKQRGESTGSHLTQPPPDAIDSVRAYRTTVMVQDSSPHGGVSIQTNGPMTEQGSTLQMTRPQDVGPEAARRIARKTPKTRRSGARQHAPQTSR